MVALSPSQMDVFPEVIAKVGSVHPAVNSEQISNDQAVNCPLVGVETSTTVKVHTPVGSSPTNPASDPKGW